MSMNFIGAKALTRVNFAAVLSFWMLSRVKKPLLTLNSAELRQSAILISN